MADYKISKPIMASTYPHATVDAASFQRVEDILTPEQLRSRFFRGIPLMSFLTQQEVTDTELKDDIMVATNLVEFDIKVSVRPTQHKVRLPYLYADFVEFNYLQVPIKPILSVEKLAITTANNDDVYIIPPEWIDNGNFHHGKINVQAYSPAQAPYHAWPTIAGGQGGGFLASGLGGSARPGFWNITFTTGFSKDGRVPVIVNRLIGLKAAIQTIRNIIPTYQLASYSLGIDGMSQSQSNQSFPIYQFLLSEFEREYTDLSDKIRNYYNNGIFAISIP